MIIVGLGQIAAGGLLLLSVLPLWQGESYVLAILDAAMGFNVLYNSIDRHDPPAGV